MPETSITMPSRTANTVSDCVGRNVRITPRMRVIRPSAKAIRQLTKLTTDLGMVP